MEKVALITGGTGDIGTAIAKELNPFFKHVIALDIADQQGEQWQVEKSAQSTISPNVQRVEIQVRLFNTETGKAEAGITHLVFFNNRT